MSANSTVKYKYNIVAYIDATHVSDAVGSLFDNLNESMRSMGFEGKLTYGTEQNLIVIKSDRRLEELEREKILKWYQEEIDKIDTKIKIHIKRMVFAGEIDEQQ